MGLRLFSDTKGLPPNPNPKNFRLVHECYKKGFLVLTVNYPDATTFEGNKVLVYYGVSNSRQLLNLTGGELDPHFQERMPSPIARFPATKQGHIDAALFIDCKSNRA